MGPRDHHVMHALPEDDWNSQHPAHSKSPLEELALASRQVVSKSAPGRASGFGLCPDSGVLLRLYVVSSR